MGNSEGRVLIIDGTNMFMRNYAVCPEMDSNGTPIGGLMGTVRSLKSLIRDTKAARVFFIWDAPGGSAKRRSMMSEYKAGRKPRLNREFDDMSVEDSRKNADWQMEKLKEFLGFLGVTQIEIQDIEADDAIGYLVGYFEHRPKIVVSSDKDMWQLISPTTCVYWPPKKTFITTGNFVECAGTPPENYVLVRALRGNSDSSDNIHGIKGLGDKTIFKLFPNIITTPYTIDSMIDECNKIVSDPSYKGKGISRWYREIIDNVNIVRENIGLMQLTSPIISTRSASIIRHAAESEPTFKMTLFKLALSSNSIQITDTDLITTFKALEARSK